MQDEKPPMKKLPTSMLPEETAPCPEFSEQEQTSLGLDAEMELPPDHGKTSHTGTGRLAGKKALITGGDSGTGRTVVIAFVCGGADAVVSYPPEEQEDADKIIALIKAEGRTAVAPPGDIRSESLYQSLMTDAVEQSGGLNILVNNAGRQQHCETFEKLTTEDFDATFKTNAYAPFWITRAALPHLQAGSAIINITSIQTYKPSPILLDYAQTKACLAIFTKSPAKQVAKRGIYVNAVASGPHWTVLQPSGGQPDEKMKQFGKDTLMGRPGQPVEVAPLYVTLASDTCSYIPGQARCSDGGDGVVQIRRPRTDKRAGVMPVPLQHDRRTALRGDLSSPAACLAGCIL